MLSPKNQKAIAPALKRCGFKDLKAFVNWAAFSLLENMDEFALENNHNRPTLILTDEDAQSKLFALAKEDVFLRSVEI